MKPKGILKAWPMILIAVLILGGVFFLSQRLWKEDPYSKESLIKQSGITDAVVEKFDTNSRLPIGFPEFLPVEVQNIIQAYSISYEKEATVQYKVSYSSDTNPALVWKQYSDIFLAQGYTQDSSVSHMESGIISAKRWDDEINVSISSFGSSGSQVVINYVRRNVKK